MARAVLDLRLYAIVDPEASGGHDLADLSRAWRPAARRWCNCATSSPTPASWSSAHERSRRRWARVPLLINDRVDVALASGADGVHIGWEDMAPEDARRLLGPDAIIGLTINSPQRADATDLDLIDYAGIGGVYGTTSKATKNTPIGPAGLARVIEALRRRKPGFHTCGIAGINAGNAAAVIEAGADGVSVISALSLAPDPETAARELRGVVDAALAKRAGRGPRLPSPLPARIPAAAPVSRPTSRRSQHSASTARP